MISSVDPLAGRETIRFTDAAGAIWTIWDLWRAKGNRWQGVPPLSTATERAFIAQDGVKKCYRFARGESHALTATFLKAELHGAGYMATTEFNASERGPR